MLEENELTCEDSLLLPQIKIYTKIKYSKIVYYASVFATSMKNKWDFRVYLDLYSCAGKSIIKETGEILLGSPLLSLNIRDPFDLYIFVEKEQDNLEALTKRIEMYFPDANCEYILGDCNIKTNEILNKFPRFRKGFTGLTFCFVDPYKTSDLHFNTIKQLSDHQYIDYLILIPSFMDINRNESTYTQAHNHVIDNFLGDSSWRELWTIESEQGQKMFGNFIADAFGERMKNLGYLYEGLDDMELIRISTGKNVRLYHLAFFSKSDLGLSFWRETRKQTTVQGELNFGD